MANQLLPSNNNLVRLFLHWCGETAAGAGFTTGNCCLHTPRHTHLITAMDGTGPAAQYKQAVVILNTSVYDKLKD